MKSDAERKVEQFLRLGLTYIYSTVYKMDN